jgi:hypothetical protein
VSEFSSLSMSSPDRRKFPTAATFWSVKQQVFGAALVAAAVLAPAQTAFAHGGNGGDSSDYRIEITGIDGTSQGSEVRSVELGNRMELTRTTAKEVQILGYEGEPYLRLDAQGVFENVNSPAHYVNQDRYSRTLPPASANAQATPKWTKLTNGTSVRWHDHRTHWMSPTPRKDVVDNPDVERVISADRVALLVDGVKVGVIVQVTWLPPPSRIVWLVVTSLLGCAVLASLVLVPGTRRMVPNIALLAAAAVVTGSGPSLFRIIAGALAVATAAAALTLKNRWLAAASALIVAALAMTRFEVFEHQLLAGWAPAAVQRVAILVAMSLAAAVVGSELVTGLGATQPKPASA